MKWKHGLFDLRRQRDGSYRCQRCGRIFTSDYLIEIRTFLGPSIVNTFLRKTQGDRK